MEGLLQMFSTCSDKPLTPAQLQSASIFVHLDEQVSTSLYLLFELSKHTKMVLIPNLDERQGVVSVEDRFELLVSVPCYTYHDHLENPVS